jgi:hypothetical protein
VTDQAQMQEVRRKRLAVLSSEVDATSSLLRAGFFLLYNYRFTALDAEPLFALFSAGSEKLLKLTIGLNRQDAEGTWPSRRQMRAYSHDILEMNGVVLALIEDQFGRSNIEDYIQELHDEVRSDEVLAILLSTFSRYATQGRFYNLDHLADSTQAEPSPAKLWEDMHQLLLQANPALLSDDAGRRPALNRLIREALATWCELIQRSWMTGVFGAEARLWGPQLTISDPGRDA